MTVARRDVIALLFEFIITLVILVGGGFLVYHGGQGVDIAVAGITAAITFWFQRRTTEKILTTKDQESSAAAAPVEPNPGPGGDGK